MEELETMWSPACAMLRTAKVDADCPDATSSAADPPSSAATRSSTTACVGFMIRV
jgi:hypothetical protein